MNGGTGMYFTLSKTTHKIPKSHSKEWVLNRKYCQDQEPKFDLILWADSITSGLITHSKWLYSASFHVSRHYTIFCVLICSEVFCYAKWQLGKFIVSGPSAWFPHLRMRRNLPSCLFYPSRHLDSNLWRCLEILTFFITTVVIYRMRARFSYIYIGNFTELATDSSVNDVNVIIISLICRNNS